MSATSQHGFHPDAETLSAFAEQALEERERGEVLEHLAVCARCRQVMALARDAADATAAMRPPIAVASNAWWKQRRLVWVPTAIVPAFAAALVSAHIWLVDRHEGDLKIVARSSTQSAAPASTPSAIEQAAVVPPAFPSPAPPVHTAKDTHLTEAEHLPASLKGLGTTEAPSRSGTPESGTTDQVAVVRQAQQLSQAEAQQAPPEAAAGTAGLPYSQPAAAAWEAKQKQAEQQRQAEVDTSRVRVLKARPATAAARGANQPLPPGAMQTVTISAASSLETQPITLAGRAQISAIKSAQPIPAPVKQIHLPSGLAVVSSTTAEHLVLAIDKLGTLFLSHDQGNTWERVNTQWTGRAVEVTQLFSVDGALQSARATQTQPAANAPANAGAASTPASIFELFNDKNQAWMSTDGRIWSLK